MTQLEVFVSESVSQTEEIGQAFAKELKSGDFVAMYGDLGAGKTAFVRGMARVLAPEAFVQSPTYTIVNEYQGDKVCLCHCDMYRIESEDDLESIGFYDYTDSIIVAEWAENIPFALPNAYYRVEILKTSEDKRQITIQKIQENLSC